MTLLKFGFIILTMACLSFSCRKEDPDPIPVPVVEELISLAISEGQNSYIGETGDHYYTDIFTHKNDTNIYRLKVKSGVKYKVTCTQPGILWTYLKIALKDSMQKQLAFSVNSEGKPEMFFTPINNKDVFLSITLNSKTSELLKYNIYFEECRTMAFDFVGYKWESSGNWKVINSEIIEFTGTDSRAFRWIRLHSKLPDNTEIFFSMKSTTKTGLPSFGFIKGGSSDLSTGGEYAEELSAKGIFFNIYDIDRFKTINMIENGAGYAYQDIDLPTIDMKNGVEIRLGHSGTYLNNRLYWQGLNFLSEEIFYLVVEDNGFDKITFESFQLNKY